MDRSIKELEQLRDMFIKNAGQELEKQKAAEKMKIMYDGAAQGMQMGIDKLLSVQEAEQKAVAAGKESGKIVGIDDAADKQED
jgi:hypothetical protein